MSKPVSFACERCRTGKRKCDAVKPVCSLCKRQNRECVYIENRPRKRKYWDEDYVKALEAQVQSLLSILNRENGTSADYLPEGSDNQLLHDRAADPCSDDASLIPEEPSVPAASGAVAAKAQNASPKRGEGEERSNQAMEELCVMLWRTNVGDGVTIINDKETGQYSLGSPRGSASNIIVTPPDAILAYCQNTELIHEFAELFLQNINREHQFTSYTSTEFLAGYPFQSIENVFLHSAIIATGATFSTKQEAVKIGDTFAEFAESLVFSCCRQVPCVKVIQGLSMSSWRSLALGRDHFGWIFISMAAGMCVHLRLHVLALQECDSRQLQASEQDIQTFWMFYIIDRTAISILGRNCALPWRRVNVPQFDTTFTSDTADLHQLSFAAQCQLWYLHDKHMDQVFSNTFSTLSVSQQVKLLISSQDTLNGFFRSRDHRLHLSGDNTPKPVLLFHLAYQMTIMITMPPFLQVFAALTSTKTGMESLGSNSEYMLLVLQSLTNAATATVRLVRMYKKSEGFQTPPNGVLVHHLLSAAIIHLMNATSKTTNLRKQSGHFVRQCLDLLQELRFAWPNRTDRSIKIIRVLAQRWGVTGSLPLDLSYKVQINGSDNSTILHDGTNFEQQNSNWAAGSAQELHLEMPSVTDLREFYIPELAGSVQPQHDVFGVFGGLANCEDFSWLS